MAKTRKRSEGDPSSDSARNADLDPGAAPEHRADRVAMRAYELYLARGGSDGQDFDDWLAAERELSSRSAEGERDE